MSVYSACGTRNSCTEGSIDSVRTFGPIFAQGNLRCWILYTDEFESAVCGGLVEGGGLPSIKKEILKRVKEEGWEHVLQTLQLTVR